MTVSWLCHRTCCRQVHLLAASRRKRRIMDLHVHGALPVPCCYTSILKRCIVDHLRTLVQSNVFITLPVPGRVQPPYKLQSLRAVAEKRLRPDPDRIDIEGGSGDNIAGALRSPRNLLAFRVLHAHPNWLHQVESQHRCSHLIAWWSPFTLYWSWDLMVPLSYTCRVPLFQAC